MRQIWPSTRNAPPQITPLQRWTRRQFALGAVGVTGSLLAGCGRAPAAKQSLQVHLPLTAYERAVIREQILPPFEQHYQAQVTLLGGTSANAIGLLRAGRLPADLLAIDTELLGLLLAEGHTTDLSASLQQVYRTIIPSTLAAGIANGAVHALPYRPTTWVTFSNTLLLDNSSLAPPKTWDEFAAAATRLRTATGEGLVALQGAMTDAVGGPAAQSLVELIWAFGGDPLKLTDAGSHDAAEYLARLGPTLAPTSREAKFDTLTRDLAVNQVAIGPNWPIVATDLIQRGGKNGIAVTPTLAGPVGKERLLSGQIIIIPPTAAQPELARQFAAYLCASTTQELLTSKLGWFPLYEATAAQAPDWQRPVTFAALEAMRSARVLPPLAQRDIFDTALATAFRQIAFAGVAPTTALNTAAKQLRGIS